ncbi:MAG: dihydrodipicolinate synthase family protein [Candidatus Aminicenantes bacterium]|nr:dihydrodipicolinate synthase family protein [Candidatus Aminicenantes bacterium]
MIPKEKHLQGIFAPLTTPFVGEEIAPDHLAENISHYNRFDLSGYVLLGSTGEAVYLNDKESVTLVKAARDSIPPGKKLIVGTARESTRETVRFTNCMARLGADAALIRAPGYFKSRLTPDALAYHFERIADETHIPVIVYNIPVHMGYSLTVETVQRLAAHPNIIGLKDSSGNLGFVEEVLGNVPDDFDILLGAAAILLPGLMMGVSGAIITLSDVAPKHCLRLFRLFHDQMWDEARRLQLDLVPLNKAIIQTMGVAATKYALDLTGFYGGPCRSPLPPLGEGEKELMRTILAHLKLI